jgi:hypothetical protein
MSRDANAQTSVSGLTLVAQSTTVNAGITFPTRAVDQDIQQVFTPATSTGTLSHGMRNYEEFVLSATGPPTFGSFTFPIYFIKIGRQVTMSVREARAASQGTTPVLLIALNNLPDRFYPETGTSTPVLGSSAAGFRAPIMAVANNVSVMGELQVLLDTDSLQIKLIPATTNFVGGQTNGWRCFSVSWFTGA